MTHPDFTCSGGNPEPFPACDLCGRHPEATRRVGGRVFLWHPDCGGGDLAVIADNEAHARALWRGYTQE